MMTMTDREAQAQAIDRYRWLARIQALEERVDELVGERIDLDAEDGCIDSRISNLRELETDGRPPRARAFLRKEVSALYHRQQEVQQRLRALAVEVVLVELDAVRLAIDLAHSDKRAAEQQENISEAEERRLTGRWMRLEARDDDLDAQLRRLTGGYLGTARIDWPKWPEQQAPMNLTETEAG